MPLIGRQFEALERLLEVLVHPVAFVKKGSDDVLRFVMPLIGRQFEVLERLLGVLVHTVAFQELDTEVALVVAAAAGFVRAVGTRARVLLALGAQARRGTVLEVGDRFLVLGLRMRVVDGVGWRGDHLLLWLWLGGLAAD